MGNIAVYLDSEAELGIKADPGLGRTSTGAKDKPLLVVGITHPQTCLVLRGRLCALREAGFRVVLISSPGPLLDETAAQEGIEAVAIPMKRGISPWADVVSFVRLWRVLRRLRPEITEFSTPKAGLLGSLASLLCGVPVRIYLLRGLRLETASGLTRRILHMAEHIAAACCRMVVCNSESLREKARMLGIGPERKLRVIGNGSSNGVDLNHFSPGPDELRASIGIADDAPVIGFVGRLTRDKGIPELVEAFAAVNKDFPQSRLLLVGWFDDSEDALSEAQRVRIEDDPNIVCTGFVADTSAWYRAMDVMVLPTWREGFPNAALEAAASEVPVITTHATGARDAVLPERTGLVVPAGDPEAIRSAVLGLLENPGRRKRMGTAGRAWVKSRFASTHVHELTVRLYSSLLENPQAQRAVAVTDAVAAGD
ncbi:MAG TPA: glycosyltransferase family 4 protein [Terracidiphilus sp.]|nr:glycosyltransferase family 4 protein [Terracidiphilus sp.]